MKESLFTAARRASNAFQIDMQHGGIITVETEQAMHTFAREIEKEERRPDKQFPLSFTFAARLAYTAFNVDMQRGGIFKTQTEIEWHKLAREIERERPRQNALAVAELEAEEAARRARQTPAPV